MSLGKSEKQTSFRTTEELWQQFKIICTAEGTAVSRKLNQIISNYVTQNKVNVRTTIGVDLSKSVNGQQKTPSVVH